MTMTDRYAVFGNPIAHSKSPLIHERFALHMGQAISYEKILAPLEGFEQSARRFFQEGGLGCNITVPFKLDAHNLADELSAEASAAGAVNTLMLRGDGSLFGHTTDGDGLVRDLIDNLNVQLNGKRILLLGAGGASRGSVLPLLREQPELLHIANRTAEKAEAMAQHFAAQGAISGGGYTALANTSFDVIINATSSGLSGELPPLPDNVLNAGGCGYDMVYSSEPTAFVRWSHANGATVASDGAGMLVEQAASAFALWRGVRPDNTQAVLQLLRG